MILQQYDELNLVIKITASNDFRRQLDRQAELVNYNLIQIRQGYESKGEFLTFVFYFDFKFRKQLGQANFLTFYNGFIIHNSV